MVLSLDNGITDDLLFHSFLVFKYNEYILFK